ncbi:MAG: YbjN domain-containing protein [Anaerolineaceae bacterium]|nr:YbjN domain-containing protein [Anaerolineaceae bacterium]
MTVEPLQKLKNELELRGFHSEIQPLSEEHDVHQLVVDFEGENELQLIIFFLSDLVKLTKAAGVSTEAQELVEDENVDFMQLFMRYPIEFDEEVVPDLARLVLMVNWSTPVGGFGLNESQKMVFYRHVFECSGDEPSAEMVADAINGMNFYANLRFDLFDTVATGEKSLSEVLEEIDQDRRREEEFPGYDL